MSKSSLIYVSTDIETNGPHIGINSMLSLASAAFLEDKTLVDTFTINLETLLHGEENPHTMKWWQQFPVAFEASRQNCVAPQIAMKKYVNWLKTLPAHPVFVAYPLTFDFGFVAYYLGVFTRENPFRFKGVDLRSLVMGLHKKSFQSAGKDSWPVNWFEDKPHTHIALDDALEQGYAFCNIMQKLKQSDNR